MNTLEQIELMAYAIMQKVKDGHVLTAWERKVIVMATHVQSNKKTAGNAGKRKKGGPNKQRIK